MTSKIKKRTRRATEQAIRHKPKRFELVQVHECSGHAEVVIRDANGTEVYAGNIGLVDNPGAYR